MIKAKIKELTLPYTIPIIPYTILISFYSIFLIPNPSASPFFRPSPSSRPYSAAPLPKPIPPCGRPAQSRAAPGPSEPKPIPYGASPWTGGVPPDQVCQTQPAAVTGRYSEWLAHLRRGLTQALGLHQAQDPLS